MGAIGLSNLSMLTIKDLTYAFNDGQPIFQKTNLEVRQGEFVSLIGASGSGKSTLFKLVTGLLEPEQGEILIHGDQTENRLAKVGYMPQKDLLLPWRTVLENILLPVEIGKGKKPEKFFEIRQWLERFGLSDYERAYPNELSGGMKQRVAFLRTLMTGKELLLLDEPFGALDSMTKRNMQSWLLGLWDELQKSVLFITHDLEEALLLSDRIYLLKNAGHIQEIEVSLPRPRSAESIYEPEFLKMRKELERLIHNEN